MWHATRRDTRRTDGSSHTPHQHRTVRPAKPEESRTAASTLQWNRGIFVFSPPLPTPKHPLPPPPPTEYLGACVKIWSSSIPLYTPEGTDSRPLLYLSLFVSSYTVFSTLYFPVHVFLLTVSTSVNPLSYFRRHYSTSYVRYVC